MPGPARVDCAAGPRVAIAVGKTLQTTLHHGPKDQDVSDTYNEGSELPANLRGINRD